MSYWAIQITRKSHCKEILSAKIVDTDTMEVCNLSGIDLYRHCKYINNIQNLTTKNDKVILCNYYNAYNTKIYLYRNRVKDLLTEGFIIVTRGYKGIYEFIIDEPDDEKAYKFIGYVSDIDTYLENVINIDWKDFNIFNGVVLDTLYDNKEGMNMIKCINTINIHDDSLKYISDIRNNLKCWDCIITQQNDRTILRFARFSEDIVEIPEGITHFGKSFGGAQYLKMPSTLEYISKNAFTEDNTLKTLEITNNLYKIPNECLCGKNIKELIIKDISIDTIGKGAFNDCIYLSGVLDTSIGDIQDFAFCGTSLEGVRLEDCKHIGRKAFALCDKLKILLAIDTDIVDAYAFAGCTKLKKVNLRHVKRIGKNAFYKCKNLDSVIVNKDAVIEQDAFPKNVKITYV